MDTIDASASKKFIVVVPINMHSDQICDDKVVQLKSSLSNQVKSKGSVESFINVIFTIHDKESNGNSMMALS